MSFLDDLGVVRLVASIKNNFALKEHTHGSMSNAGAISSDTSIASGDKIVIIDNSDNNKIKRSNISFGSATDTYLRNDGTWVVPDGKVDYTTISITLSVANWSNNSQTVTVSGVTETNLVIVNPTPSDIFEWSSNEIVCSGQSANSLTFTCYSTPTVELHASVVIFSKSS